VTLEIFCSSQQSLRPSSGDVLNLILVCLSPTVVSQLLIIPLIRSNTFSFVALLCSFAGLIPQITLMSSLDIKRPCHHHHRRLSCRLGTPISFDRVGLFVYQPSPQLMFLTCSAPLVYEIFFKSFKDLVQQNFMTVLMSPLLCPVRIFH
jgi:hypothetical protein